MAPPCTQSKKKKKHKSPTTYTRPLLGMGIWVCTVWVSYLVFLMVPLLESLHTEVKLAVGSCVLTWFMCHGRLMWGFLLHELRGTFRVWLWICENVVNQSSVQWPSSPILCRLAALLNTQSLAYLLATNPVRDWLVIYHWSTYAPPWYYRAILLWPI